MPIWGWIRELFPPVLSQCSSTLRIPWKNIRIQIFVLDFLTFQRFQLSLHWTSWQKLFEMQFWKSLCPVKVHVFSLNFLKLKNHQDLMMKRKNPKQNKKAGNPFLLPPPLFAPSPGL
jgi:hypothetical protein